MAMSLARAYERHAAVIAVANKSTALVPLCSSSSPTSKGAVLDNRYINYTGLIINYIVGCPASYLQAPNADETRERCRMGLCYNYDEQLTQGHKCKAPVRHHAR